MASFLLSEELLRVHKAALDGGLDFERVQLAGDYVRDRIDNGHVTQLQEVKLAFACFIDGYATARGAKAVKK